LEEPAGTHVINGHLQGLGKGHGFKHQSSQQARLGVPPQQMAETLWCLPTNQLNQSWVGS